MMKFLCRLGLTVLYVAIFYLVIVDLIGCPLALAAFIVACLALANK